MLSSTGGEHNANLIIGQKFAGKMVRHLATDSNGYAENRQVDGHVGYAACRVVSDKKRRVRLYLASMVAEVMD